MKNLILFFIIAISVLWVMSCGPASTGDIVTYHCKYHATTMRGTITLTNTSGLDPLTVTNAVSIMDGSFSPADISMPKGSVVRWVNNGSGIHTVTADDASFDSGDMLNGNVFHRIMN